MRFERGCSLTVYVSGKHRTAFYCAVLQLCQRLWAECETDVNQLLNRCHNWLPPSLWAYCDGTNGPFITNKLSVKACVFKAQQQKVNNHQGWWGGSLWQTRPLFSFRFSLSLSPSLSCGQVILDKVPTRSKCRRAEVWVTKKLKPPIVNPRFHKLLLCLFFLFYFFRLFHFALHRISLPVSRTPVNYPKWDSRI